MGHVSRADEAISSPARQECSPAQSKSVRASSRAALVAAQVRADDRVDIAAVAAAALPYLPSLCERWLPSGRREGREWVCGSLRGEPGRSCKVNLSTGRWCDFATGERGGDAVALAAAIAGLTQVEAARRLATMLGMEGGRT